MIIIFVLLFLTLIVGKNINGSKSWINLGFELTSIRIVENCIHIIYFLCDQSKITTSKRD